MITKLMILDIIKTYPDRTIKQYLDILRLKYNATITFHTLECHFYTLHKRKYIKRLNKDKFFRYDYFCISEEGLRYYDYKINQTKQGKFIKPKYIKTLF